MNAIMKKTVLQRFAAMLVMVMLGIAAQAQVQYLIVTHSDGAASEFALADAPVVTCQNGTLEVTTAHQTLAIALSEVENYHFTETLPYTAIDEVKTDDTKPLIEAGHARFENLPEGTTVNIFTIDGRRAGSAIATDGSVDIDLTNLGTGIYILSTPKASYKIINR